MTRWLITGANGMLGTALRAALAGQEPVALGRAELDVTDAGSVERAITAHRPDVVLNAAAYTAVDAAETAHAAAYAGNAEGPATLAAACAGAGVRLLHVSTDYVFAGDATTPYEPTDPTGPRTVYGASKLAGEQAVLAASPRHHVVRTAWLYGRGGANFVSTMARLAREGRDPQVVDGQRGSPTWTGDLAAALVELGGADIPGGALHYAGGGETTWFGLARAVFAEVGADPERVSPCGTDRFPRPAPRPAYSVLGDDAWRRAGLTPPRPWRAALTAAFASERDALLGR
ncbi:dTDP-4-dehydrorhamnose reductase [Pseudonocardia sp. H11422]|uniref:dTDP-4-dehydrorhamnose reductase n=1 Tax=Pseudonocardia sp. H11422 TaxID=2835866 RepID=UPI001BDCFA5A|nr:dTDP-4-dehydrorhamnose reductase [Pseudonocardia sp. H11422]